jgi:hypothetical protein
MPSVAEIVTASTNPWESMRQYIGYTFYHERRGYEIFGVSVLPLKDLLIQEVRLRDYCGKEPS